MLHQAQDHPNPVTPNQVKKAASRTTRSAAKQPVAAQIVAPKNAPTPKKTPAPKKATRSATKAPRKKTVQEIFEDEEDVVVDGDYKIKKWAGKKGNVVLKSSQAYKVMVIFEDGTSKLIEGNCVKSLC